MLASWTHDLIQALCSLLAYSRQVVNNVSREEEKPLTGLGLEGILGCWVLHPKEEALFLEACVVCHLREWASCLAWI